MSRYGDRNSFWDNAAAGANSVSNAVELSRSSENLAIYVTVGGATTITVEAAHPGDVTNEGILADGAAGDWGQVVYNVDPIQFVFAGAGSRVLLVPDFAPSWVRLRTSAAVTITAGHLTSSER